MKKIILIFLTITSYSIKCSESIIITHLTNADATTYALEKKTTDTQGNLLSYSYKAAHLSHTNPSFSASETTLSGCIDFVNPQECYEYLKTTFEKARISLILKGNSNLCKYQNVGISGLISSLNMHTHK